MNEIAALRALLAFAVAGCSVVNTSTGTTGAPRRPMATATSTTDTSATPATSTGTTTSSSTATTTDRGSLVVPSLIGKTPEQAASTLAAAGFVHTLDSSRVLECPDGPRIDSQISCQEPAPGTVVTRYGSVRVHIYRTPRIVGAIVRAQLQALLGMTPEQAKAALASYGHVAEVTVTPASELYARCGDNRVCAFSAAESGIDVHDPITLYINPGISISAPPPP